jgi:hypothetical protein
MNQQSGGHAITVEYFVVVSRCEVHLLYGINGNRLPLGGLCAWSRELDVRRLGRKKGLSCAMTGIHE